MAKKKHRAPGPALLARPPQQLLRGLDEADGLVRRKKMHEARELLETLDRRFPNQSDVLGMLVNANYDLGDLVGYLRAIERLAHLQPDDADVALGLAGAYLSNTRPVLALIAFRKFLERFPGHPRAADARKTIANLEVAVEQLLAEGGLEGPDALELAEQHEQLQSALGQGEYAQVRKLAEQLLKRKPDFAPVLNNLAMAYSLEGKLAQAITTEQRVLEFAPRNIHALANLVIYHCRLGRLDDAHLWAERLKQSDAPAADRAIKVAEALCFLGDDEGVLEIYRDEQEADELPESSVDALLYHLAAVATMRLGNEPEARRLWQRALKLNSGLDMARANLDDLRQPIGDRHAPWPFALGNWITPQAFADLRRQTAGKSNDKALASAIRSFLQKHPEIAALVPILLDRGDPQGRQLAMMLAETAQTPAMLAALHDFAVSQRGPDSMRHKAAQAADAAGLFPDRQVGLWMNGQWQEIQLLTFKITNEVKHVYSARVEPLALQALEALRAENGAEAELLIKQALELEPDSPSLLNNLARALEQQGRREEALSLTHEIYERFPDYVFARVAVARTYMLAGDLDTAGDIIKPIFMRRQLHLLEAAALFAFQVDMDLARGNTDAARTWLDMWAGVDPDNPELLRRMARLKGGLKQLFSRRR